MLFKMTFILLEILKGVFFWPNHASVVLPALGNYDRQLPNLRFCPERKAASRFCPFRCASKRHFQPWAGSNCDYFRFLFLDDTKHRGIRVAMWPHARCLQTTSLGLADSMSDRRRHRFNSSQILTATRKWWKWGLRCQRKTTESERERETDKEWTGLDGVVTHTDGYIHIYNQVKSDRLHLNLHLFYSFFFVCLYFIYFFSLSQPLGDSCSIFSLPLIGHRGAYLPSDWTRTLSPSRSPTFSPFSHNAHGWWAGAKGLSNHCLSHQSKLTGPSDMKRNLSSSH